MCIRDDRSNSMGLFLQKTNIIRDINEDVQDGRHFWPKEVWGKYFDSIDDIIKPENRDKGMAALNEMWTGALSLIPDVLDYLSRVKEPTLFKFCAIPQVMAIATMAVCFNNPKVLETNVKIRKGEAIKLIMSTTDMGTVCRVFLKYIREIQAKNDPSDPNYEGIHKALEKANRVVIEELAQAPNAVWAEYNVSMIFFALLFGALSFYFGSKLIYFF
ncbi:bifunctional farnesyl-diphosphate farnesyltransferase/squalene synthase [Spiromyces aspiralis]|uniref:Bifunctional farnesyl-diphosphate farnesyltransferase/squalene synthase n=1 Tax=Spiromyces aspiralis TaxID=68401 RepID=A0ACC1HVM7_9FUNG|nr:bifunctional farnesyl-diphosphate farnesyltransferase/squalene synthase [Spiromyces aspiralis]